MPGPRTERTDIDPLAATLAGLAAGGAFAAVLEADIRLTGNNVDDLTILGRPLVDDPRHARSVGLALHGINSVALAGLYAAVERFLPGPPWLKGVIFANVENVLLYPIVALEELHPSVQDGAVDSYRTWPSFWQSVPRHIVYGAVLGVLYEWMRQDGGGEGA